MRKADNLPPSCAIATKSGNLNFLEPSGPVTGLLYLFTLNQLLISPNILSIFVSKFSKFGLVTIILISSMYKRILVPVGAKFGKI